jgi:hypothetical protein
MHQLAKGEAGDYTKLPKYNDEQLRASGLLDYSHFKMNYKWQVIEKIYIYIMKKRDNLH